MEEEVGSGIERLNSQDDARAMHQNCSGDGARPAVEACPLSWTCRKEKAPSVQRCVTVVADGKDSSRCRAIAIGALAVLDMVL